MAGNFPEFQAPRAGAVDFSWIGDLPQTIEEAQAKRQREQALSGFDMSASPDQMEAVGRQLMQTGNPLSFKQGAELFSLAKQKRDYLQQQQTIDIVGKEFGGGTPTPQAISPPGGGIGVSPGDPRGMIPFISDTAKKYGIDPQTAVRVAASEGLGQFSGDGGKSGGAFQLYTGGGMGNEFTKDTGLNPLDPANERATIDYALKRASQEGWGAWNGAKKLGIGQWEGISRGQVAQTQAGPPGAMPGIAPAGPQPYDFGSQQRLNRIGQLLTLPNMTKGSQDALLAQYNALLKGMELPPERKLYEFQQAQRMAAGQQPESMDEWQQRQETQKATIASQSKEDAQLLYKDYGEIYKEGQEAFRTRNTTTRMRALLDNPNFVSGPGAGTAKQIAGFAVTAGQILKSFVRDPALKDRIDAFIEKPTNMVKNMEEFTAIANKGIVAELGGSLGKQISDPDRVFMTDSFANLSATPGGNRRILDFIDTMNDLKVQRAQIAANYMDPKKNPSRSKAGLDQILLEFDTQARDKLMAQAEAARASPEWKGTKEEQTAAAKPKEEPKLPEGVIGTARETGGKKQLYYILPGGKKGDLVPGQEESPM